MKPVQVEYDIDNNEWLASTVDELDVADELKAYAEKKKRKKIFHFVKKVKAAEACKANSVKRKLKAAEKAAKEQARFSHTKPDVEYDIDKNKWLLKTLIEMDNADRYAEEEEGLQLGWFIRKIEKRADKKLRLSKVRLINEAKAITLEKQKQNAEATKIFLEKMFDAKTHVEQRFIKKYKGADTSVAMRTLDKQKRNAEMFYTDADLRRQQRLFDDNCKKVARLVSRELCQEQGGIKISCKNPNLRQKMYLFNDVKKVTRLMLNDLRQK